MAHPDDRDLGRDKFAELGRRDEFSLELRFSHKSGRIYWVRVTYSCFGDKNAP
ncbi:MAG: PAS domain-containing protein [Anaerolineales bacterium]|nr:PAS domain-containing protein [Anaerolineales bacterium]